MDPATLAAAAVSFVTPYLLDFAKNLGSDAASEGSKRLGRFDPFANPFGERPLLAHSFLSSVRI